MSLFKFTVPLANCKTYFLLCVLCFFSFLFGNNSKNPRYLK